MNRELKIGDKLINKTKENCYARVTSINYISGQFEAIMYNWHTNIGRGNINSILKPSSNWELYQNISYPDE